MTGTWEVWEVINESGMDHPFHHHTNSAQVLSITGGNAGYASLYTTSPAWKDVTIVPPRGRVRAADAGNGLRREWRWSTATSSSTRTSG